MTFTRLLLLFAPVFLSPVVMAQSPIPAAPQVAAKSYFVMDFHSGRVMAHQNSDARMAPASLTKIMTAYVVYQELRNGTFAPTDLVTISEKAWRMPGSRMFVEVGDQVSVENLLQGVVIQSGNDSSVALAEFVAGSEESFADYMNVFAQKLGMSGTNFVNSTGLPSPEHYSTARDMAILTAALIRDFPEHYAMYSQRQFTFNDIVQYNRNKLLWRDKTVDGVKTGYTKSADYCLVASALRDGMRLISVVLGAADDKARVAESQKLLGYGFRFFETHRLYAFQEVLNQPRIWKGETETLPLGITQDLYVTIPRGHYESLNASMDIPETITAPVTKGQSMGTLRVALNDEVIDERPLVALSDVSEGSLLQWARDTLLQYFE